MAGLGKERKEKGRMRSARKRKVGIQKILMEKSATIYYICTETGQINRDDSF